MTVEGTTYTAPSAFGGNNEDHAHRSKTRGREDEAGNLPKKAALTHASTNPNNALNIANNMNSNNGRHIGHPPLDHSRSSSSLGSSSMDGISASSAAGAPSSTTSRTVGSGRPLSAQSAASGASANTSAYGTILCNRQVVVNEDYYTHPTTTSGSLGASSSGMMTRSKTQAAAAAGALPSTTISSSSVHHGGVTMSSNNNNNSILGNGSTMFQSSSSSSSLGSSSAGAASAGNMTSNYHHITTTTTSASAACSTTTATSSSGPSSSYLSSQQQQPQQNFFRAGPPPPVPSSAAAAAAAAQRNNNYQQQQQQQQPLQQQQQQQRTVYQPQQQQQQQQQRPLSTSIYSANNNSSNLPQQQQQQQQSSSCSSATMVSAVPPTSTSFGGVSMEVTPAQSGMAGLRITSPAAPFQDDDESTSNNNRSLMQDIEAFQAGLFDHGDPLENFQMARHHLLSKQHARLPATDYMRHQRDINPQMREILVDWLVEVAEEYRLKAETLHLAVNYIDRFLAGNQVARNQLQLVGVACMLIAAKYEEIFPPQVDDFVYITDNTYTREEVLRMETCLLRALRWELTVISAYNVLALFARGMHCDERMTKLGHYLVDLTLQDYMFVATPPAVLAAAALSVSSYTLTGVSWPTALAESCSLNVAEVRDCAQRLHAKHANGVRGNRLQAVRERYRHFELDVTGIPPRPGMMI